MKLTEPWRRPQPIDAGMWSRPCLKCHRRIDKCVCPNGPTTTERPTNDSIAIPAEAARADSDELWAMMQEDPESFKERVGLKER